MISPSQTARAPIVVAVDGSPESANALRWAACRADEMGCELRVITCYRHHYVAADVHGVAWDHFEVAKQAARQRASDVIKTVLGDAKVEHILALGPVDTVLIDHGRDASLIVLGTRESSGIRGALRSSTTNRVTGKVGCPVVSIPLEDGVLEGASP